eukprot:364794-Chlamydomonas_euryale.AAC.11
MLPGLPQSQPPSFQHPAAPPPSPFYHFCQPSLTASSSSLVAFPTLFGSILQSFCCVCPVKGTQLIATCHKQSFAEHGWLKAPSQLQRVTSRACDMCGSPC